MPFLVPDIKLIVEQHLLTNQRQIERSLDGSGVVLKPKLESEKIPKIHITNSTKFEKEKEQI